MALTAQELFDAIDASGQFPDKLHWVADVPFAGTPGHLYFVRRPRPRPVSFRQLARTTQLSGNAEVTHMEMDGTSVLYIGSRSFAAATVFVPPVGEGIDSYRWVAHTHPLEQESAYEGIARGPTRADRVALEQIHERWGQTSSVVLVCRGGRVEREVTFEIERDRRPAADGGRIWTPAD